MKKLSAQTLLKRVAFALPVTLVGLFASANAYGNVILDNTLLNSSFELGNQASGCPVDWTCAGPAGSGLVTSYLVTSSQYTAGSDGLGGGLIVPFGTHAATTPTPIEGSGTMTQQVSATYLNNTIYTVDLWVGTPKVLPSDGTTPVLAPVAVITAYFLGNGGQVDAINVTAPAIGQWSLVQLNFDTTGQVVTGETIGFSLHVDAQGSTGSGNQKIADFDIGAVPEPATFALMGLGLLGLGVVRKKLRS